MELAFVSMKSVVETAGQHREELKNARALLQDAIQKSGQEQQKHIETLQQTSAELDGVKKENLRLENALAKAEERKIEVEETLSAQVKFLSQNYKTAFDDIKKLSSANADLMGHQNAQQKIHHIGKLKEELVKLKQVTSPPPVSKSINCMNL
ncbi:hypothetical protein BC830DRAFT_1158446 [Chytriomyces sp. MP71]|nr:hypothetical protein BC830DRAFT_1158446 [Chytriomyces sp. MP71]